MKSSLRPRQAHCIREKLLRTRSHRLYSQAVVRSVVCEDGTRTYRARSGSNRALPLPPLMDPIAVSAKQRYKEPKLKPDYKNLTPFQKKLQQNPYGITPYNRFESMESCSEGMQRANASICIAHALATPPRMCSFSLVRLPQFFHLDLYPKPHPETGQLWLVPSPLVPSATSRTGIPLRILGRRDVLDHLGTSNKVRHGILSVSLKDKLGSLAQRLGWREDMSSLILSLLRRSALQKLRWPFQYANAKLVRACPQGVAELDEHDDVGCLLHMRPLHRPEIREVQTKLEKIEVYIDRNIVNRITKIQGVMPGPGVKVNSFESNLPLRLAASWMATPRDFPTAVWRGERVSVYSLVDLLGEQQTRELLMGTKFEGVDWVILKRDSLTVSAQMWLLKLQGYLAEGRA